MASIEIRQEFLPGEKVCAHHRVGDYFADYALGDAIAEATTDDRGTVNLTGFHDNQPVWLVGEHGRHLAAHAKPDGSRASIKRITGEIPGDLAAQTRPVPTGDTVEGARDTKSRTQRADDSKGANEDEGDGAPAEKKSKTKAKSAAKTKTTGGSK